MITEELGDIFIYKKSTIKQDNRRARRCKNGREYFTSHDTPRAPRVSPIVIIKIKIHKYSPGVGRATAALAGVCLLILANDGRD